MFFGFTAIDRTWRLSRYFGQPHCPNGVIWPSGRVCMSAAIWYSYIVTAKHVGRHWRPSGWHVSSSLRHKCPFYCILLSTLITTTTNVSGSASFKSWNSGFGALKPPKCEEYNACIFIVVFTRHQFGYFVDPPPKFYLPLMYHGRICKH